MQPVFYFRSFVLKIEQNDYDDPTVYEFRPFSEACVKKGLSALRGNKFAFGMQRVLHKSFLSWKLRVQKQSRKFKRIVFFSHTESMKLTRASSY